MLSSCGYQKWSMCQLSTLTFSLKTMTKWCTMMKIIFTSSETLFPNMKNLIFPSVKYPSSPSNGPEKLKTKSDESGWKEFRIHGSSWNFKTIGLLGRLDEVDSIYYFVFRGILGLLGTKPRNLECEMCILIFLTLTLL